MAPPNDAAPVPGDPGRAPAVRDMFARIAPGYDRANTFMSMGIDRWWRVLALRALGPAADGDMLDLCAGTMDFSVALAPRAKSIVAVDFCAPMLEAGAAKIPAGANVRTVVADARALPLADASVDGVVIGFGIRNVPEPERALAEAHRVLRPGGVLVVVDFFKPTTFAQRFFAGTYNRVVLPVVGGLVTGDSSAYRYLAGSMAAWTDRAGFETMCRSAGFAHTSGGELFPPVASLVIAHRAGGPA
jgi:demethylmenaquinone methyltransferase/2-methoxy-6-polyprenyl-1,4-benzoquinol methylase